MGGNVNDLAFELSHVRGGGEIDKANVTTTLTELLGEMQNLTEHQRVGEAKRRNLETQLGCLNKVTHGGET